MLFLLLEFFSLFMDLDSAGVASVGTPAHHDLLGLPIDLGVVFLQPQEPKDQVLLAEVGNSEVDSLSMPVQT